MATKRLEFRHLKNSIGRYLIFIILFLFCIVLAFSAKGFLTTSNLLNVLRQVSYNGVIAVGMTFVIITGGIDLSVGSVVGLSAIVACTFAHPGEYPLIVPILVALAIGAFIGLINGIGISYGHVPPFIMTLGMMTIGRGAVMLYNDGKPMLDLSDEYGQIGKGDWFGVPIAVYILVVVLLIGWFILNKMRFGRHILAIGGNEQASKISGLNVPRVKTVVYVMSGVFAAIAGLIISSRTSAATPVLGEGYEQDAIAAAVIGGTSMVGGYGSIIGTVGGILIIGVMNNGLDLLRVSSYYQQVAKGAIIILAVLFDMFSKRKK